MGDRRIAKGFVFGSIQTTLLDETITLSDVMDAPSDKGDNQGLRE